jgi:hypothetical protein
VPNSKSMMGAGLAPLTAGAVAGSLIDTMTATGSTQATALQLSADNNIVTTAAAGTGVILPFQANTTPGDSVTVTNLGANALLVYPVVGGAVQAGATNAGFSIPTLKSALFIARNGGLNWAAILSA